ncbi:hypothetical protein ADK49_08555, partial [Streptomyces sp. WM6349]
MRPAPPPPTWDPPGVPRWEAATGVPAARPHCDGTGPSLNALDALLEVRNRVPHVRTHCDPPDPSLTGLDALLEVRDRVRDVMTLQIVAF